VLPLCAAAGFLMPSAGPRHIGTVSWLQIHERTATAGELVNCGGMLTKLLRIVGTRWPCSLKEPATIHPSFKRQRLQLFEPMRGRSACFIMTGVD